MRKTFAWMVVGVLVGLAAGFALGIFVYPFWFPPPPAMERVVSLETKSAVAGGEFIHVNPSDPIHWGKGHVTIYRDRSGEQLLHLEEDFEVGPGPAFHVYLVTHPNVRSKDDFVGSERVDLGMLRAFQGSQNYAIPPMVQLPAYESVVIWCEEFGVLISPAHMEPQAVGSNAKP